MKELPNASVYSGNFQRKESHFESAFDKFELRQCISDNALLYLPKQLTKFLTQTKTSRFIECYKSLGNYPKGIASRPGSDHRKFIHSKEELELTKVIKINQICQKSELSIFILSSPTTSGKYFEKRQATRKTWVSRAIKSIVNVFFVIGEPKDENTQKGLEAEAFVNKDMIQFGFQDSYYNLTLKSVALLRWAHQNCLHSKYILKTDDDTVVNIEHLLKNMHSLRKGITGCLFRWQAQPVAHISHWERVTPEGDENAFKSAVDQHGPVAVAIHINNLWTHYKQGIYDERCKGHRNHAVLVVGYGYDKLSNKDYWIVKNQWGEGFGEKGYIRMRRNKNNMCDIAGDAVWVAVSIISQKVIENKNIKRKYRDEYLKYGFISIEQNSIEKPFCVICYKKLENNVFIPAKLKRHLDSVHKELCNKSIELFERKKEEHLRQTKRIKKSLTTNDKCLKASYVLALNIINCKNPYNIGEELILLSLINVCKIFFGEKVNKIKSIPLSNDTVKRRAIDMSDDIEKQLIDRVNRSKGFSIQISSSTDITKSAQLLAYN